MDDATDLEVFDELNRRIERWAQAMRDRGFDVDTHCHPPFAYTSPRFVPTRGIYFPAQR